MKVYIDGEFKEKTDAKVSVFDHGFLYGDGVFEGIRAYNGRVFMLDEHINRLFASMNAISIEPQWTREAVCELVLESLRVNNLRDAYIRLVVSRGYGDLGLDMRKCPKPSIIIIADKIQLYPEEYYQKGLSVATVSIRRPMPDMLNPNIKSLNYLNNIMARAEAARQGAQEALLLNANGYVSECSGDNIFYIKDGKAYTPPVYAGILEGITRDAVIKLLGERMGMKVEESLFTTFQLFSADEAFLTGTGAEVIAVTKLDGRSIGGGKCGPLTMKLVDIFREYARANGVSAWQGAQV